MREASPEAPTGTRCARGRASSHGPISCRSQAIYLAADDDPPRSDSAASTIERALAEAPAGNAGWLLPVEPMLAIASCPGPWLGVLARLRSRAA